MKGKYFSWLSHDDEYEPDKILHQIESLSACSSDTICVCGSRLINTDSKPLNKGLIRLKFPPQERLDWSLMLSHLFQAGSLNGCSLLIPKAVFDDCGYFDESLRFIQDFSMWVGICLRRYSWIYNDHIDVLSRVHNNQVTQTKRDLFYSESSRLSESLIPRLLEISDKKHNYLYLYAKMSTKGNCKDVAQASIKAAASKKLFGPRQLLRLKIFGAYGKIRPWIRKMYYKFFRHVKTQ